MDNKDQAQEPKVDPSYTGYGKEKEENLLMQGLKWYQQFLQPGVDWLANLFTPGPEEQTPPPSTEDKPTTIRQAVDRYYNLPYKKNK